VYGLQVLGTPTKDELKAMNPNYQEFRFPQIRAHPWGGVFKPRTPADAIDLVGRMLAYVPDNRCRALEVGVRVGGKPLCWSCLDFN